MMERDFFQKIVDWGNERGLIGRPFDYNNEVSFIVEELLESTGSYDSDSAREKSKKIANEILNSASENPDAETIVDAFGDIIVYATGTMAKLGYDPTKVMNEIHKEINSRTGKLIDGKFVKDTDVETYKADFSSCKR